MPGLKLGYLNRRSHLKRNGWNALAAMNKSYVSRISEYCIVNGIDIPAGFKGGAQRYAAIDLSTNPPKLVAVTWFKHADVIYFIKHFGNGRQFRFLDFKERVELHIEGDLRLTRGQAF